MASNFLSTVIVLVSTLLIALLFKKPVQVGRTFVWNNCIVFSLSISTKKLSINEIVLDIKYKKNALRVHLNDVKFVFAKWSIGCQGKKSSGGVTNRGKKLLFCVTKLFLLVLRLIDVYIKRCHLLVQESMQQNGQQCADQNETTVNEKLDNHGDTKDGATTQGRKMNTVTAAIDVVLSNVYLTKNRGNLILFRRGENFHFVQRRLGVHNFVWEFPDMLLSPAEECFRGGVFMLYIYFYLNCLIHLYDMNMRIDRSIMKDFSLLKHFLAKKRKEKKNSKMASCIYPCITPCFADVFRQMCRLFIG
ncbi:hypothetical protein AK88_01805 [Plasmodium fragile]|uniref:Uncharacterized protein n=1 Tax=Plasmodium fragile TaxID=5857 RepID=A0A0D9QS65_PLAFR|nr:uncharacterized protein AK88_01805 [Plasmodium fragile]KJP88526.1 hypothetical protein AK88_01805 [Plasmodium fragile]